MSNITITQAQVDAIIETTDIAYQSHFGKCLVAVCKLPNGWIEVIDASCVDPENFDEKLGKEIILERLSNKIWELEGYALQKKLGDK